MTRKSWIKLAGMVCVVVISAAGEAKAVELAALADQEGYSIGYQLGSDFKVKKIQVNPESLAAGMKAAQDGTEPALSLDQMRTVLADLQKKVEEERRLQFKKLADDNKLAGDKYLAENAVKEDVTTLPSGLQYKILKAGDGIKPVATSKVTVHYRGTLPDGTEFDSSYKRGQPATFPLNGVIPGWIEGLQLMSTGSKWQLFVPGALGYGERGYAPKIGPNQTLVFEVELLAVE